MLQLSDGCIIIDCAAMEIQVGVEAPGSMVESGNHFSLIDFYYLTLCMQVERQLSKMTMIVYCYTLPV